MTRIAAPTAAPTASPKQRGPQQSVSMLPLSLLNAAQGQPLMVELKSGETVNGTMVACDSWMNLTLKDVIYTSADAAEFKKLADIYLRGTLIKYVRVPDALLEAIKNERHAKREERRRQNVR